MSRSLILLLFLSTFSKSSALQIDENSVYYNATYFNGLWNEANWDAKFGGGSGSDATFSWNTTTNTLTISDNILIKRSTSLSAPRIMLTIDGQNGFDIIMQSGGVSRKIEVDQGEYLMLTNQVEITSSQPYWDGIKAYGNSLVSQFDLGFPFNIPEYVEAYNGTTFYNYNQTMLVMEGGSKIYKALTALYSVNGAILIAANSSIDNCKVGVKIENYIHPTDAVKENLEYRNASYLSDMSINVNALIDGSASYTDYRGVSLSGVHGVHIQGTFINNAQGFNFQLLSCMDLGIGIYSYNSSFSLHKSGTAIYYEASGCYDYSGQKSQIHKFSYGIYSEESSTPPTVRPKFAIQENDFRGNLISVSAIGGTDYAFKDNTVEIQTTPNWSLSYACPIIVKGLTFTNVGSFGVVNNFFYPKVDLKTSSTNTPSLYMLEVDNGGSAANKIQNNHFMGSNLYSYYGIDETGLRMRGNNEKIEPWCRNRFEKLHYGIYIENGTPNPLWARKSSLGNNISLLNTYTYMTGFDLVNNSSTPIDYCEDNPIWITYSISGSWQDIAINGEEVCAPLNCTFWTPLFVKEAISNQAIVLYPNPSNQSEVLHIQSEEFIEGELFVFDLTGKKVISTTVVATKEKDISLKGLPKGAYLLLIDNSNYSLKKVFIVN